MYMITFKAIVISNNKRRDGTYPVKIRVTFRGKTRRLPTTMVCKDKDLTRSLKIKNADILNRADELIGQMRRVAMTISPFDLECHDVDWVVMKIKKTLQNESFSLDFFEWADTYLNSKKEETRRSYITALNSFAQFLGDRTVDINNITKSMILDFVDWSNEQPKMYMSKKTQSLASTGKQKKGTRQTAIAVRMLATIFMAARARYNDEDEGTILIPRQPFATIPKDVPASDGQKNLGEELMQRIISADTDDSGIRLALDAFIVSFGLMGANMADLYTAKPFKGGVWKYNRQKTSGRRSDHAEMRVTVPEQLRPYLERLTGEGGYWLNAMHEISSSKDGCTGFVNRHLKQWCIANNVTVFTFYAARHSWASMARKAGVEKATIDECLAHIGSFDMADIYAERSWELMTEANRKVLDMFTW